MNFFFRVALKLQMASEQFTLTASVTAYCVNNTSHEWRSPHCERMEFLTSPRDASQVFLQRSMWTCV